VERAEAEAIYGQGRDAVVAVLLRMDEQIQRLDKRVARQDERIAQLERRVGRSSRNSSQPPSSDPPSTAPKRDKDRSGRKQGAQPGHEGKGRTLLPAWAVDEVVEHWPTECDCGHVFDEAERVSVGRPTRHQVEELPVMAVTVIEHRCQRERCPGCGQTVTAMLPSEVASSAFGPRLQAAIVTLSIRNRISRRDVVELCEQLFSSRISGAEAVRDALAAAIITLPEQLRRSLTWDQGAEMAQHARLRIDTGLPVYFCDPQSPWQRGTNENTNGAPAPVLPEGDRSGPAQRRRPRRGCRRPEHPPALPLHPTLRAQHPEAGWDVPIDVKGRGVGGVGR
jgi:hypothetical protein